MSHWAKATSHKEDKSTAIDASLNLVQNLRSEFRICDINFIDLSQSVTPWSARRSNCTGACKGRPHASRWRPMYPARPTSAALSNSMPMARIGHSHPEPPRSHVYNAAACSNLSWPSATAPTRALSESFRMQRFRSRPSNRRPRNNPVLCKSGTPASTIDSTTTGACERSNN